MVALEIEQLKKTYAGGFEALKGVSLTVEQGDFYALLGPNGAGKSTTIGIITSLVNKTSGKVSVFGHDIDKELELAKQQLGLVPQEFNFNQFETVEQIVLQQAGYYGVPKDVAKQRAQKYLSQLDLWEKRSERAPNRCPTIPHASRDRFREETTTDVHAADGRSSKRPNRAPIPRRCPAYLAPRTN